MGRKYNFQFLPVKPHGHWQTKVLFWIKQVPPLKQLFATQSGILQFEPKISEYLIFKHDKEKAQFFKRRISLPVKAGGHVHMYNPLPKFVQVPPLAPKIIQWTY